METVEHTPHVLAVTGQCLLLPVRMLLEWQEEKKDKNCFNSTYSCTFIRSFTVMFRSFNLLKFLYFCINMNQNITFYLIFFLFFKSLENTKFYLKPRFFMAKAAAINFKVKSLKMVFKDLYNYVNPQSGCIQLEDQPLKILFMSKTCVLFCFLISLREFHLRKMVGGNSQVCNVQIWSFSWVNKYTNIVFDCISIISFFSSTFGDLN